MALGRAIGTCDSVEEFWALKNVSFQVKRAARCRASSAATAGEKATLLQILSPIPEPSEGRVIDFAATVRSELSICRDHSHHRCPRSPR
jgi:ABC-type polysaccharide/polyol phosphate transport system ATPase subunit